MIKAYDDLDVIKRRHKFNATLLAEAKLVLTQLTKRHNMRLKKERCEPIEGMLYEEGWKLAEDLHDRYYYDIQEVECSLHSIDEMAMFHKALAKDIDAGETLYESTKRHKELLADPTPIFDKSIEDQQSCCDALKSGLHALNVQLKTMIALGKKEHETCALENFPLEEPNTDKVFHE